MTGEYEHLVFLVQYSEVLCQEKNIHQRDMLLKLLDLQEKNNNELPATLTRAKSFMKPSSFLTSYPQKQVEHKNGKYQMIKIYKIHVKKNLLNIFPKLWSITVYIYSEILVFPITYTHKIASYTWENDNPALCKATKKKFQHYSFLCSASHFQTFKVTFMLGLTFKNQFKYILLIQK